jgi:geranylgeranyl diphosphate synthase type I
MTVAHVVTPATPAPRSTSTRTAGPAALRDQWAEIQPALRAAVAELREPVRGIASYHFGWTTAQGRPAQGNGGKYLRAALVLRCAQAISGSPGAGLPGAVAVELVHNSTLLQDDVMDLDRIRRHRPTAWTLYGTSQALLAGDALVVLGLSVLMRDAGARGVPAAQLLADSYQRIIVGQALDVGFEARADVPLDDCYQMVSGKTAALLACATKLGALLAGADQAAVDALGAFGHHLGVAFQFVDDILGIWGEPASTGKPVGSDILTRKKSLPVAYALATADPGPVIDFYAQTDPPTPRQVEDTSAELDALGAREWAERRAQHHLRTAIACLDRAELSGESRDSLLELARMAITRTS